MSLLQFRVLYLRDKEVMQAIVVVTSSTPRRQVLVNKEQETGGTTLGVSRNVAIEVSGLPPRKHKSIEAATTTRIMGHDQNQQQRRQSSGPSSSSSSSSSSPPITYRKCKRVDSCHHPHRPHAIMWTVSEDGHEE